jgi:hypothetical protein
MKKLSCIMKRGTGILFIVAIVFLSGCGVNSGLVNQYSVNGANTNVILQKKNFKVIGTVTGESADSYIFFIGGNKQNLVSRAKQSMIESAKLDGTSNAIINVTTEEHDVFKFVYIKRVITVHGTVIEFLE